LCSFLRFFCCILELFGQCGILELFGQCGILELFGQCGILELFGQCGIFVFLLYTFIKQFPELWRSTLNILSLVAVFGKQYIFGCCFVSMKCVISVKV
jgi:hypothetical protein